MNKLLFAILITCAGLAGAAQSSKDEGCAANVTGSIQALETMQDKTGKTQSLSGLTIAEIQKIAAERGCVLQVRRSMTAFMRSR